MVLLSELNSHKSDTVILQGLTVICRSVVMQEHMGTVFP